MPFKYNAFSDELDYYADTLPTIKLTDLTDGFIPYHVSDALGLDDSIISQVPLTGGSGIEIDGGTNWRVLTLEGGNTNNTGASAIAFRSSYDVADFYTGYVSAVTTGWGVDWGSTLEFWTNAGASAINVTKKMDISPSGDVSITLGSLVLPASEYVSYVTQGAAGYGFRDNSGQIEVKDSGGTWREVKGIAIGGYYFNSTGADPATELGYGTWTQVAIGQFLIGAT